VSDRAFDLDFFWDPVCPWAYITSRWVAEVQQQREYTVNWRFISLKMINEGRTDDWYTPEYKAGHMMGLHGLRVADALRLSDPDAVGDFYTALGSVIHRERRRGGLLGSPVDALAEVLTSIGQPPALADAALDERHDAYIREETELAFSRTGKDVGTPILTFHPGADNEASFFGPVIASIPRGADAVRLWDAVEIVATTSGMAELKRSNRAKLNFD
jgi:hypothetical protein